MYLGATLVNRDLVHTTSCINDPCYLPCNHYVAWGGGATSHLELYEKSQRPFKLVWLTTYNFTLKQMFNGMRIRFKPNLRDLGNHRRSGVGLKFEVGELENLECSTYVQLKTPCKRESQECIKRSLVHPLWLTLKAINIIFLQSNFLNGGLLRPPKWESRNWALLLNLPWDRDSRDWFYVVAYMLQLCTPLFQWEPGAYTSRKYKFKII